MSKQPSSCFQLCSNLSRTQQRKLIIDADLRKIRRMLVLIWKLIGVMINEPSLRRSEERRTPSIPQWGLGRSLSCWRFVFLCRNKTHSRTQNTWNRQLCINLLMWILFVSTIGVLQANNWGGSKPLTLCWLFWPIHVRTVEHSSFTR